LGKSVGTDGFIGKDGQSKPIFKTPRPRPERPKVGADIEFGTLL